MRKLLAILMSGIAFNAYAFTPSNDPVIIGEGDPTTQFEVTLPSFEDLATQELERIRMEREAAREAARTAARNSSAALGNLAGFAIRDLKRGYDIRVGNRDAGSWTVSNDAGSVTITDYGNNRFGAQYNLNDGALYGTVLNHRYASQYGFNLGLPAGGLR